MHNLHIAGADRPVIVCSPYSQAAVANDRPALTVRVPPAHTRSYVFSHAMIRACTPLLLIPVAGSQATT